MAAATDDGAAVMPADFLDDLDFNIDVVGDLDFDFDLGDLAAADEFCDSYAAFLANADASEKIVGAGGGGWMAGLCGGGDGSSEVSTGSSGVTDGGSALAGDEDVSAFVAELEQFLMEDGDCELETEESFCPDDFFGDLLDTSGLDGVATPTSPLPHNGEEEDNAVVDDDGDVLAAREDGQPSRKRARHKIKGTAVTPWRRELEVTMRHLARFQVPAPWQPAVLLPGVCLKGLIT